MKIAPHQQSTSKPSHKGPDDIHAQAQELLNKNETKAAIALLEGSPGVKEDARTQALLGAAYFRQEEYAKAADSFEAAATQDESLKTLAEQSRQNAATDIKTDHAKNPFDKKVVLGAPQPGTVSPAAAEPCDDKRGPIASAIRGGLDLVGKVTGGISGLAMATACKIWGKEDEAEVWTTWSRKNFVHGLLILKGHRDRLNENNLHDTYPEGELTGFAQPGQKAPDWAKHNRTYDGSWNNLANPKEGAAGTRFGRNVPRDATFRDDKMMLEPNPRMISRLLQTRNQGLKEVPFLNMLSVWWIQMQTHDWVSHGDNRNNELYEVPLEKDDPKRQQLHMTHMFVPKSAADPSRRADEANTPDTYLNEVTHWWDGSQIYGSDEKTAMSLRSGVDGKMKIEKDGTLPIGKDGVEMTGFSRNWTTGLSVMHTVFVKEHNAICDMLKQNYPNWNDDQIYHKARLINAALMAKIHTSEWTPNVLPNKLLDSGMQANWYGELTNVIRSDEGRKTLAWWRSSDEAMGGLVGNKTEKHGVPAWLSEEFVSDYAILHSMLPDELKINPIDGSPEVTLKLNEIRQRKASEVVDKFGHANLLHSFGTQHPGQMVLNNYPETLQNLSVPGFGFMDLATVDILRDRERGVPRYNDMRRHLGLNPITKFEDLTDDPQTLADLKKAYKNNIELIDFKIGCLAETVRPENFGFGETQFTIFILHASRRLQADRFYTEDYTPETYTPEGLEWIDKNGSKSVLLRHHPELANTGLKNVKTIFEPWDTDPAQVEDPGRHPLTKG